MGTACQARGHPAEGAWRVTTVTGRSLGAGSEQHVEGGEPKGPTWGGQLSDRSRLAWGYAECQPLGFSFPLPFTIVIFLKKPLMVAPLCGSPNGGPVPLYATRLCAPAPAGLASPLPAALHPGHPRWPSGLLVTPRARHSFPHTVPTSLPNELPLLGPNHLSTSLALVYGFATRLGAESRRASYP